MKYIITLLALTTLSSLSADYYSGCQSGSCKYRSRHAGQRSQYESQDYQERKEREDQRPIYSDSNYGDTEKAIPAPNETYRAGDLVMRTDDLGLTGTEGMQDSAATPQDRQLNAKIRHRLKNWLSSNDVEAIVIKSQDGNVIILGTVQKAEDAKKITDHVQSVEGVKKVDNQVRSKE